MSAIGRKLDPVWNHFLKRTCVEADKKSTRAKCRKCGSEMAGLVARLKSHYKKCRNTVVIAPSSENAVMEDSDDDTASNSSSNGHESDKVYKEGREPNPTSSSQSNKSSNKHSLKKRKSDSSSFDFEPFATSSPSVSTLDSFVSRTSAKEKNALDSQVAKFIFATNSAFMHVEHPEFIKLMSMLRPGYLPPNRQKIGGELLNEVYEIVKKQGDNDLKNKNVCLMMDGWSNVHVEPIVYISLTNIMVKRVHLLETVNTEDNRHTSEYLLELVVNAITNCKKIRCHVSSVVTDNASNMSKMRENLSKVEEIGMPDIITYGCSAHIFNLLAKDIDTLPDVKSNITKIIKYFKYHHFPAAKYKQLGGTHLKLPHNVRWNTLADSLESYTKNWHILSQVCTEHRISINPDIAQLVNDVDLKIGAQNYAFKLKKISVALDKVQGEFCTISEAAEIWITLLSEISEGGVEVEFSEYEIGCFKNRFDMAMTAPHFLANLLDHRFCGQNLDECHLEQAMNYCNTYHPEAVPFVIKYQAKSAPFNNYLFSTQTRENVSPLEWWCSLEKRINKETVQLTRQLHTAVASSAGIERLFSSFGLVHSKLRNRLGVEEAAKLVTIFRSLNSTNNRGRASDDMEIVSESDSD